MNTEYHKIDSIFMRNEKGKFIDQYTKPEFEYLADKLWVWTEKIDGTNIRIMWDGYNITLGGKTDNAQLPNKLVNGLNSLIDRWQQLAGSEAIDGIFHIEGDPVTLYGEGYGAGIQKGGGNYSPEQKFILFDVKIGDWWLERHNIKDIARTLNLDVVKVFGEYSLTNIVELVSQSDPPQSFLNPNALMEGFVGTPKVPLWNRKGERIITKIKFRDF